MNFGELTSTRMQLFRRETSSTRVNYDSWCADFRLERQMSRVREFVAGLWILVDSILVAETDAVFVVKL